MATIVRSNADLNSEELLGFLEFHTIGELRIHKDKLGEIFKDNGLSEKFLPNKIQPHDAYRRATKEAQSTVEVEYNNQKMKARLLVREVKTDTNMVIRHLVREIVNEKQEKLDYNTVGKFIFNRKTGTMDIDWAVSYLDEYPYDTLMKQIRDLYVEWTEYHTKETVHNITRRVINSMKHVSIMPNGKATFIPKSQRMTLDSLQGMVEDLAEFHTGDTQSIVEIIPVIDTIDQRRMIENRVEIDISNSANELLASFATMLESSEDIGMKTAKSYARKVYAIEEKLEEYKDLLGMNSMKLNVLHNQLNDLMDRIKWETKSEVL